MKSATYHIEGGDGVELFVRDGGNENGPPILFVHGWSQHHLCWSKQFEGPLAKDYRLVAIDLRGHGASDMHDDPEYYVHSKSWADDIAAVIETCEMDRPLVVAWSLGGRILLDYMHHYGCEDISGLALVGASVCFAGTLSKMDLATMVGFNMLVPPHIRRASRLRDADYEPDFGAITCPVSLFWGDADKLFFREMIDETLSAIPQAKLIEFPGTGHAPFWERTEKFDTHLAEFARETLGVTG